MAHDPNQPELPRVEPEIIPPDRSGRDPAWRAYQSSAAGTTQRIYVARLGPFGAGLLLLAFAILGLIVMLAVLGAVLIWIPAVLLVVLVAAIFRHLRR